MESERRIQPLDSRVLVELDTSERKYGNIVIPKSIGQKLDVVVSRVLARGTEMKARRWELAEGDYVLHVRTAVLKYDGILGRLGMKEGGNYGFVWEKDILAVVDPGVAVEGKANMTQGEYGEWHQ